MKGAPRAKGKVGKGMKGERVQEAWGWRDNSFKEICSGAKAGGGQ